MKWFLLIPIQFYWKFLPVKLKRRCLFKETCSHHVYDETKMRGFIRGIHALIERWKSCRSGYIVYVLPDGKKILITADGRNWESNLVNEKIIQK